MNIHYKDLEAIVRVAGIYANMSTAERLKVGCVIFDQRRRNIISVGYNGTPTGDDNMCEDDCGVTKSKVIHAECNALNKLPWYRIWGKTMYITVSPCVNCAKIIAKKRIKAVIYGSRYNGTRDGLGVLEQAGIKIYQLHFNSSNRVFYVRTHNGSEES